MGGQAPPEPRVHELLIRLARPRQASLIDEDLLGSDPAALRPIRWIQTRGPSAPSWPSAAGLVLLSGRSSGSALATIGSPLDRLVVSQAGSRSAYGLPGQLPIGPGSPGPARVGTLPAWWADSSTVRDSLWRRELPRRGPSPLRRQPPRPPAWTHPVQRQGVSPIPAQMRPSLDAVAPVRPPGPGESGRSHGVGIQRKAEARQGGGVRCENQTDSEAITPSARTNAVDLL